MRRQKSGKCLTLSFQRKLGSPEVQEPRASERHVEVMTAINTTVVVLLYSSTTVAIGDY